MLLLLIEASSDCSSDDNAGINIALAIIIICYRCNWIGDLQSD